MIIEAAEREFLRTLNVFEKARGDRPFILVTPLVTTNGGANYRQAETYHYSEETWAKLQKNRCGFDFDGIAAVAADSQALSRRLPVFPYRVGGGQAYGLGAAIRPSGRGAGGGACGHELRSKVHGRGSRTRPHV
jgi:hypothetical protein